MLHPALGQRRCVSADLADELLNLPGARGSSSGVSENDPERGAELGSNPAREARLLILGYGFGDRQAQLDYVARLLKELLLSARQCIASKSSMSAGSRALRLTIGPVWKIVALEYPQLSARMPCGWSPALPLSY